MDYNKINVSEYLRISEEIARYSVEIHNAKTKESESEIRKHIERLKDVLKYIESIGNS